MKYLITFWVLLALLFNACVADDDELPSQALGMKPIYIQVDLDSIYSTIPKETKNLGKIVYKNPYIFINERYKGIHVIDNTNPENPINVAFWQIPGNVDFTIDGNILYADNTRDLYVIDITDIRNIKLLNHLENIYREPSSEQLYPQDYNGTFECADLTKGIVVDWQLELLMHPKCWR